eukprot:m.153432 g.153432  ORF g.153432 m.153432 type:complete len:703 (-) comp10174_c1_seq6:116-2224(-)
MGDRDRERYDDRRRDDRSYGDRNPRDAPRDYRDSRGSSGDRDSRSSAGHDRSYDHTGDRGYGDRDRGSGGQDGGVSHWVVVAACCTAATGCCAHLGCAIIIILVFILVMLMMNIFAHCAVLCCAGAECAECAEQCSGRCLLAEPFSCFSPDQLLGDWQWLRYWVVLRGPRLFFFKSQDTSRRDQLVGHVDILDSECVTVDNTQRKKGAIFCVSGISARFILRAESEHVRKMWVSKLQEAGLAREHQQHGLSAAPVMHRVDAGPFQLQTGSAPTSPPSQHARRSDAQQHQPIHAPQGSKSQPHSPTTLRNAPSLHEAMQTLSVATHPSLRAASPKPERRSAPAGGAHASQSPPATQRLRDQHLQRKKDSQQEQLGGPLRNESWFFDGITRVAAEKILHQHGQQGSFLVRASESRLGDFTMSCIINQKVMHFKIEGTPSGTFRFAIRRHNEYSTLHELVRSYIATSNGKSAPLHNCLLEQPSTSSHAVQHATLPALRHKTEAPPARTTGTLPAHRSPVSASGGTTSGSPARPMQNRAPAPLPDRAAQSSEPEEGLPPPRPPPLRPGQAATMLAAAHTAAPPLQQHSPSETSYAHLGQVFTPASPDPHSQAMTMSLATASTTTHAPPDLSQLRTLKPGTGASIKQSAAVGMSYTPMASVNLAADLDDEYTEKDEYLDPDYLDNDFAKGGQSYGFDQSGDSSSFWP